MNWTTEFENFFCILPLDESAPYLIIEGEQPYRQILNDKRLAVEIDENLKNYLQQNSCDVYDEFDSVAFLVRDWIKIQDSLEMLFNLMTGNSHKSLAVLSYLRTKQIPINEFVLYLYNHRKIILVNRFKFPLNKSVRKSQLMALKRIIQKLNNVHLLVVGNRACKFLRKKVSLGNAIHTSGVVLNNFPEQYYRTWYLFNDDNLKEKSENFSLRLFSRL
ncbi:MAG: hypothetical protein SCALA702_01450 [Melioribacteraceae bacterium]|nr:MAG: hypothetical protein SCALA702_01450 [Melioribacteraceae bacterium]